VTDADTPIQPALPQPGLSPLALTHDLLARIDRGIAYAKAKRKHLRRASAAIRVGSLVLSAAATIILGLQDLDFWTGLGFALISVATVVNTLEPFFAWRARWVLMEETQYRFHRLHDEVSYYLAATQANQIQQARVRAMFDEYQEIWARLGEGWLEYRKHAPAQGG
jgi:hypothetical protein